MQKKNKKKFTFPVFWMKVLFIALLAHFGGQYIHWLAVLASALVINAIFAQNIWKSLLSGFVGGFLSWAVVLLFKDLSNGHILMPKLSDIFQLPHSSLYLLVVAFIGGILGLCGSWIGFNIRQYFKN